MEIEDVIDNVHPNWKQFFSDNSELLSDIFSKIYESEDGTIYPKKKNIFKVFKYIAPEEIKIILLGQDPYIGYELVNDKKIPQAEGLSFSVPKSHRKIPPSLKNIFKEIKTSYPEFSHENGNLKKWVKKQKIFLLNSSLTVVEGKSNSHQKFWPLFTDKVIKYISEVNKGTVFILMGNNAKSKVPLINPEKHSILTSVHPSPLSASRGFFGCKIFEKANNELNEKGLKPIKWSLS